jgi:hypothetical protein
MSKLPTPAPKQAADLTPEEMTQGISKLEKRVSELKALDIERFESERDPSLLALQTSIESTLEMIFGAGTTDYNRYIRAAKLDLTVYTLSARRGYDPNPPSKIRKGIEDGRDRAIALLEQAARSLADTLEDSGETETGRALRAYEGLDLHPEIERAAGELYRGGHYANAIEDSVKALNEQADFEIQ